MKVNIANILTNSDRDKELSRILTEMFPDKKQVPEAYGGKITVDGVDFFLFVRDNAIKMETVNGQYKTEWRRMAIKNGDIDVDRVKSCFEILSKAYAEGKIIRDSEREKQLKRVKIAGIRHERFEKFSMPADTEMHSMRNALIIGNIDKLSDEQIWKLLNIIGSFVGMGDK